MGIPRVGRCLCGAPATIRDTKAEDGRIHFVCHDLTDEGKAKHYGFVDSSEATRVEIVPGRAVGRSSSVDTPRRRIGER